MSGYGMMLCLCGFMLLVLSALRFAACWRSFLCFSFSVLSPIEQFKADTVINKWQGARPPLGLSTEVALLWWLVENLVNFKRASVQYGNQRRDQREMGNKAKILGCCLRRSPSTDVWSADYGCLLVYETPDCSGEFHRFENLDQVKDFLVKREQSGA